MLISERSGLQRPYLNLEELHGAVSFEWQGGLYLQVHLFPAFDSVHKESLRSILRIYLILKHIVRVIKQIFSTDYCCSVRCSDLSYHVNSSVHILHQHYDVIFTPKTVKIKKTKNIRLFGIQGSFIQQILSSNG